MSKPLSKISRLGLGTAQIGSVPWGWGKAFTKEDVKQAFARAFELGITTIDTAEDYGGGVSERVVGEIIRGRRDELFISTKVSGGHLHYDDVLKSCEASLKRLDTNYIDLYYLHWPNYYVPLRETMRAMDRLRAEGKIVHIGVSNYPVPLLREAQQALPRGEIAMHQLRYNIIQREIETEILPYCRKEGIAITAYSPLAQGMLTGKYHEKRHPLEDKEAVQASPFKPENLAKILPVLSLINALSKKYEKTSSQVALKWLEVRDVYPIVGTKKPFYVEEAAGTLGWQMARSDLEALSQASEGMTLSYYSLDF